jgi:hypothetical protein
MLVRGDILDSRAPPRFPRAAFGSRVRGPSPEVRWTMTSTFQPSLDRLWPNPRGLVVAVAGIVFGVMSQVSLVEGSLRSEFNYAAVATAHRDFRPERLANWERVAAEPLPTRRSPEWRSRETESYGQDW